MALTPYSTPSLFFMPTFLCTVSTIWTLRNRLVSHADVVFAGHGTLLNECHGERTRNEALGTQSALEARNRLYQYMGWKNLVSTLNMGPSYCSHFSLLVTPTATHNATTNLHVPFTVGSQIREPSVVDDTDFQYDWFTLCFWPGKNVFLIFPLRGQDGIFYFFWS